MPRVVVVVRWSDKDGNMSSTSSGPGQQGTERMGEAEGGRWSEEGRTGCGGRRGLKTQAGPMRNEQITRVQDGGQQPSPMDLQTCRPSFFCSPKMGA